MKQIIRYISIVVLLMTSAAALARGGVKVEIATLTNGTITSSLEGLTCTLTVTPAAGYYIRKGDITVQKTVDPSTAKTRGDINVTDKLSLTGDDPEALSAARTYTFDIPEGYNAYVTASFTACSSISLSVSMSGWTYGSEASSPIVTGNTGNAPVSYSYAASGSTDFTATKPVNVGEYTVKATVPAISIYTAAEATASFTITAATISGVTPTDYSGTYDGAAHTIGVTIPEGATIMYGTAEGTYDKETAPSYTNAGEYTVYYQVTKANYNTITGSAKVTINKKALTITAEAKTKVYGEKDPELTYKVEGLIEGESLTGALTRAEGEAVGEYDITQGTLAVSNNYSVTFVGAKLTITAATISGVTPTDYSGTYDGAAHTIGVTIPEGATIMYGTAEGTYDKETAPSYTNAGEYTVYYQVTKANYNTITGSAKVTINKKALTITAEAKTKVYGEKDPELTYKVEGLIEGESLTGALTRAEGEAVGEYDITQGTLAVSNNYSVTFVGAKLTITAANTPADPEPNTEVVNTEDPVTVGDETFYQPSQTVQDAISNNVNTGISFSAEASKDVKVNENGGLEFGKSDKNVDVALTDMHKGETVTFNIEGTMQADASKLKEKGSAAGARRTRTEGKINLVSGKEYEVLEDGNIVITVVLTDAPATINSIKKTEAPATGIEGVNPSASSGTVSEKWYDMNGRSLQGKPTKKGLYIHNGVKVLVGDKR